MYATGVNKVFEVNQVSSRTPKVRSGSNLIGFFIGDMIMGCVYLTENTINRKCYIGKTIGTLEQRKQFHQNYSKYKYSKMLFHKALQKYGFKEFEWIILYESNDDKNLIRKEIHLIRKYKTKVPFGYNLTDGGEGIAGHKHTKETKEKMSKLAMGNQYAIGSIRSKEYLKKQSISHIGKRHSEETKEKMSKMRKGIPKTKEENRKNSLANMGRIKSKETRKKSSIALKQYWTNVKSGKRKR